MSHLFGISFFAILSMQALSAATPTFHKDVLPILQSRCQGCHRPGEIGPMPLLTYSQARPFAAAIRETVRLKKMPPWGADPAHGRFANDPSLTAAEIATLSDWALAKAPEGDANDAPKPRHSPKAGTCRPPTRSLRCPSRTRFRRKAQSNTPTSSCRPDSPKTSGSISPRFDRATEPLSIT